VYVDETAGYAKCDPLVIRNSVIRIPPLGFSISKLLLLVGITKN
jgi:hypothetical protein